MINLIKNRSKIDQFSNEFAIVDWILIVEIRIDVILWSRLTALESELLTIRFGDPNRISLEGGMLSAVRGLMLRGESWGWLFS